MELKYVEEFAESEGELPIVVLKPGSIKGDETIFSVMTLAILPSITLHGLSAKPFAKLSAKNHKEAEA